MTFDQKHKPTRFNQLVFEDPSVAKRLEEYASNTRHRHLLLVGDYGVAKSTTALLIAQEKMGGINPLASIDVLNAAEVEGNISSELARIQKQWRLHEMSGVQYPVAIIDELHLLQPLNQQYRLRAATDVEQKGQFIFTANNLQAIDKGIQNRCDVVEIVPLSAQTIANRCEDILRSEGVKISRSDLMQLLKTGDGTWRDALRALEDLVIAA